jgi:hypothetical protein
MLFVPIIIVVYCATLGASYYRMSALHNKNSALKAKVYRLELYERCRRKYLPPL